MPEINWFAALAAAIAFFALGALWFSKPLFEGVWKRSAGLPDDYASKGSMPLIFGGAFVLIAISAILLAFLTDPLDFGGTLAASLAAGVGFALAPFWMLALFERKSFAYVAVNGGYLLVGFAVMGVILGAWK